MANKMADKKKNINRPASITPKVREKGLLAAKSINELARTEQKAQIKQELPAMSIDEMAHDARTAQAKQDGKPVRNSSVLARNDRKERPVQESKSVRRESRGPSFSTRIRNNSAGRFTLDAYYELRHKVTWPTFIEARNMTFIVIGLSVAIGALLGLVDFGLNHLFFLISGH